MASFHRDSNSNPRDLLGATCLSLADGYLSTCPLVLQHNEEIGAPDDEILLVPSELRAEFEHLSTPIYKLSRAFELGLMQD